MEKILGAVGKKIIQFKFLIIAIFAVVTIGTGILGSQVKINEDMVKYMPDSSETVQAIEINGNEFGNYETFKVMIKEVKESEVTIYIDIITNINDGNTVMKVSQEDYKDGNVLLSVTLKEELSLSEQKESVDYIREALVDKKIALAGHVVTENYVDEISGGEAAKLLMVIIPILAIILILSSKSFFDPVICLIVIIVSIMIGTGTNVIFTDVSSITNNMFSVLMIAISMDYSIFLLHTYTKERDSGTDTKTAIINTLKKSFTTISTASLTSIAGFLIIALMTFTFGADIGLVFAKGILISFLTAIILTPCLLIVFDKIIKKTTHRKLLPSFGFVAKGVNKARFAIIPVVFALIIGGFALSNNNNFIYGNSTLIETPGTRLYDDNQDIINTFGRKNNLVVLLPKSNNLAAEDALVAELLKIENIDKNVISLSQIAKSINPDLVNADIETVYAALTNYLDVSSFHSDNYARIVLNLNTSEEGKEAFAVIELVKETIPENAHLLGSTSVALDMKNIVNSDYLLVTILTILAFAIILAISFKSLILPLLLILTIQGGVFINMGIPALTSQAIPYVAYLLISTIQLGATIDYAILFTEKYLKNRQTLSSQQSSIAATKESSASLLTSGGILAAAGLSMYFTSGDATVAQMGLLLGRGSIISVILVFTFLPALLVVFDNVVQKTILKKR